MEITLLEQDQNGSIGTKYSAYTTFIYAYESMYKKHIVIQIAEDNNFMLLPTNTRRIGVFRTIFSPISLDKNVSMYYQIKEKDILSLFNFLGHYSGQAETVVVHCQDTKFNFSEDRIKSYAVAGAISQILLAKTPPETFSNIHHASKTMSNHITKLFRENKDQIHFD